MEALIVAIFGAVIKEGDLTVSVLILVNIIILIYGYKVILKRHEERLDDILVKHGETFTRVGKTDSKLASHIKDSEHSDKIIEEIKEEAVKTNAMLSIFSFRSNGDRSVK